MKSGIKQLLFQFLEPNFVSFYYFAPFSCSPSINFDAFLLVFVYTVLSLIFSFISSLPILLNTSLCLILGGDLLGRLLSQLVWILIRLFFCSGGLFTTINSNEASSLELFVLALAFRACCLP